VGWTVHFYLMQPGLDLRQDMVPCRNVIFFSVLGLELRAYTLSHSTSPFL
jgi:hypothetical protein